MKTQSNFISNMSKNEMTVSQNETTETFARVIHAQINRPISSADLWNIQRQQRTLLSRRRCF